MPKNDSTYRAYKMAIDTWFVMGVREEGGPFVYLEPCESLDTAMLIARNYIGLGWASVYWAQAAGGYHSHA